MQTDALGFLERAVAWFAGHGVHAERVLTDNGSAYRSQAFAATCTRLGLRHTFTRPYRPRTNGKAERFIQTLLREWAYRRATPPRRSPACARAVGALPQPQTSAHGAQLSHAVHPAPGARGVNNLPSQPGPRVIGGGSSSEVLPVLGS